MQLNIFFVTSCVWETNVLHCWICKYCLETFELCVILSQPPLVGTRVNILCQRIMPRPQLVSQGGFGFLFVWRCTF